MFAIKVYFTSVLFTFTQPGPILEKEERTKFIPVPARSNATDGLPGTGWWWPPGRPTLGELEKKTQLSSLCWKFRGAGKIGSAKKWNKSEEACNASPLQDSGKRRRPTAGGRWHSGSQIDSKIKQKSHRIQLAARADDGPPPCARLVMWKTNFRVNFKKNYRVI